MVFIRSLIKQTASCLAVTVKREARFLSRGFFAYALEDVREGVTMHLVPGSAGARPRVDNGTPNRTSLRALRALCVALWRSKLYGFNTFPN